MEQTKPSLFAPEQHSAGDLKVDPSRLRDGFNLIETHKTGMRLWANVLQGRAICWRATFGGKVLPTLTFFKPDPTSPPLPDPSGPPPGSVCPGGPIGAGDGGTDGGTGGGSSEDCSEWVCSETEDGGVKVCWRICILSRK